jgi:excisionase family DNA binding protein
MAAARPETTGRKPRGERQRKQTEPGATRAPAAERLVYTVPEAGRLLGLSRNGSYEAAKRGDIPTIRIGRLLLVPKVPFHRIIECYGSRDAGQEERFREISTLERRGRRSGEGGPET